MQLLIDIKDRSMVDKIIKILDVFKNDGVEIKTIKSKDEEENTQEFDVEYERSFQYKLDRAEFMEMKKKL